MSEIEEETYKIVRQIPAGRVSTYGAISRALGDVIARRVVGQMVGNYPPSVTIPCHRVVMSDGSIGGFTGAPIDVKIEKLAKEGVSVRRKMVSDFRRVLFTDFKTSAPLARMAREQEGLARKLSLSDDYDPTAPICALDVSYSGTKGWCAAVIVDPSDYSEDGNIIVEGEAGIPYIPTYLSYKEMPLMLKALKALDDKLSILLIDGNGIYHPRGLGIASHIGIVSGIASIGIAKSNISRARPSGGYLRMGGKIVGSIVTLGKREYYASPGDRTSVEGAMIYAKMLGMEGYRKTLGRAHSLAEKAKREATKTPGGA